MGETFYTVLGVSRDADAGAIRQAYREQVKECHPDVSDDPEASARFKRLTTARDVLVDTDERATYDRLGHDSYVSQHVETDIWKTASTTQADSQSAQTQPKERRSERSASESVTSTTQAETNWRNQRRPRNNRQPAWSRADGGYADEQWQRAPNAYTRSEMSSAATTSPRQALLSALRRTGSWLLVHFALIVSALVTSWFLLGYAGSDPAGTIATGLFSLLLIAIVSLLSGIHILLKLL